MPEREAVDPGAPYNALLYLQMPMTGFGLDEEARLVNAMPQNY
jgi:hypothetical protein